MWFRQMAQLSTTISHAQRATAFHCSNQVLAAWEYGGEDAATFFTSNRFLPSSAAPPVFAVLDVTFDLVGAEGPASGMSTSMSNSCNYFR